MSLNNTVNVKDLPQAEEIVTGNYLLLEDESGTKIIDFKNFVVGPTNTSFYNAIVTNIRDVSSYCIALSGVLDKYQRQTLGAVNSQFNSLTARFNQLFPLIYTHTDRIDIESNTTVGSSVFNTTLPNIATVDINISQINFDFQSKAPVSVFYPTLTRDIVTEPDGGTFFSYTLTISTLSAYSNNIAFNYKVFKTY
jgi:hypothetical protein